jgi:hypothetical protein
VKRALGIVVHTGWAACVVAGGSSARPEIVRSEVIHILGDAERFCYHMAARMQREEASAWIARTRAIALINAKRALSPLTDRADICAIVAKDGAPGSLDRVLESHARIHAAEGSFYRDVLREACSIPVKLVAPASLDPATVGKLAKPPWGRDQRLASLAAWSALTAEGS